MYTAVSYSLPFGFHRIHSEKLDIRGEPLVEPNMVPPFWRYQVAEPLYNFHKEYDGKNQKKI